MGDRAKDCRISPAVYHGWEQLDVPHLVTDVLDAVFALPDEKRIEHPQMRPPLVFYFMKPVVLGRKWIIYGQLNADGEWRRIFQVSPL